MPFLPVFAPAFGLPPLTTQFFNGLLGVVGWADDDDDDDDPKYVPFSEIQFFFELNGTDEE